ncbi:hypothetical protein [Stackebrandtia soli]|uniref:hypothetical protein n=1 Tax=Stackebrandtia soli TaxID=1892856 RepID=UPI0039E813CB
MRETFSPAALILGTLFLALAVIGVVNTYVAMSPATMILVLSAACTLAGVTGVARMAFTSKDRRR